MSYENMTTYGRIVKLSCGCFEDPTAKTAMERMLAPCDLHLALQNERDRNLRLLKTRAALQIEALIHEDRRYRELRAAGHPADDIHAALLRTSNEQLEAEISLLRQQLSSPSEQIATPAEHAGHTHYKD